MPVWRRLGGGPFAGLVIVMILSLGVPGLSAHATSGEASGEAEVSFHINREGHVVVPLQLNGLVVEDSIFDTAATFPLIDMGTAERGGISPPLLDARRVQVLSLTGFSDHPVIHIGGVRLGGIEHANLPAALNEDSKVTGVDNVVPANLFAGDVLDINFEERVITAYNGRPKSLRGRVVGRTKLIEREGLYYITVRINGRPAQALIDTGSSVTYINSAYAREANAAIDQDRSRILQGIAGVDPTAQVANVRNLKMGGFRFRRLSVIVADPELFGYLGFADTPTMVIGTDVLSAFRVQIDRKNRKLLLSPPAANVPKRSRATSGVLIGTQ